MSDAMTSIRLPLSALCAVLLLAMAPSAQAQWKWRDADGRTQYSDRPPPPHVADKDILSRPSVAVPRPQPTPPAPGTTPAATGNAARAGVGASGASAPGRAASEASSRERIERERKAAEDKLAADTAAENCRQAQNQVRLLESGVRLSSTNERGERIPMDDTAKQEKMRQMQAMVTASCK
ncbi:MAG: DUF4124 domain-containing protein [Burkholderiaceae bacterium]